MPFASDNRFVYFADVQSTGDDRSAQIQAAVDLSFEPDTLRRH